MTTLKRIALLLIVGIISVGLFAAGAKEEIADGQVTVKVLNYLDLAEPNSANEIEKVWNKYYAEHPEVKVVREDLFNEPFHQKTESYVASGKLPDIVYLWPAGRSASLYETGAVQDLRPWLERDGLIDDYTPAALAQNNDGFIGELPSCITSSHMLYVNEKVLEKYNLETPKTLQDFIDMVPVLAKDHVSVIAMDNMDSWVMQSCLFSAIVGRYGSENWFDRLEAGEIDFTDDWFMNALNVIDTLYNEGVISRSSLNSPYTQSRGNFVNGKAAFYIDGDWAVGGFMEDQTTGKALVPRDKQVTDFNFMVFPECPGEVLHNSTSGVIGTGYGLSADLEMGDPRAEAAWDLIKYLQGPYVQEYRLATGAAFPSNLNVDVEGVIKAENLEPFVQKRSEFYSSYDAVTPVIDSVLKPEVFNVINIGLQEIGLGEKTPAQVAAEVQAAYEEYKSLQN